MGSFEAGVPYGRRLLTSRIDELAFKSPDKPFGSVPRSLDLKDGYVDISWGTYAKAVNRASAFLDATFGKSTNFETVAYIGPFDLRYFVLIAAACKTGYKLLLPSPRNSLQGQLNLFKSTDCKRLLSAKGYNISPDFLTEMRLQPVLIPSAEDFLAPGEVEPYHFTKTFDEAKYDPFMVLHTSGSTGLPKPITIKHEYYSHMDSYHFIQNFNGYGPLTNRTANLRLYLGLPPFHGAGIFIGLIGACWFNHIQVWGPTNRPVSASLVNEILDVSEAEAVFIAPSIVEEMSYDPESLKRLERLKLVGYGGAPLDTQVGNRLSEHVYVLTWIGATEVGILPTLDKAQEDWEYFNFSPAFKGVELRPMGDGTYELVFVRDPSTDPFHGAFSTFPDLAEYSMNDIYRPHPTKPNLFRYVGRTDDVIVLSNGEKLNPSNTEMTIRRHPGVKGALIVGQGRFSVAAVVELRDRVMEKLVTAEQKAKFIEDEIWPYVMEANEEAPAHAQLGLDHIILSKPEKPFARAGKGSMQRSSTVALYAEEIHEIYQRIEEGADNVTFLKIPVTDLKELEARLRVLIADSLKRPDIEPEDDFFAHGMDSLHVMTLVKQLRHSVEGAPSEVINTRLIYNNSTLSNLTAALHSFGGASEGSVNEASPTREEWLLETMGEFIAKLPSPGKQERRTTSAITTKGLTVLLTGSTGSLGSYLLHTLLSSPQVDKVCCLNRSPDAEQRQVLVNAEKGLISTWNDKVSFLHADLSKPNLDLEESMYEELRSKVSIIIHNAWPVSFNLPFTSFVPHIQGVLNLISLSSTSPLSPTIFFTSTIGTLSNLPRSRGPVPETHLDDPSIPMQQGYSESKWVSEQLLDAARKKSGVSSAVLRVGQISGPVNVGVKGVWNKQEWLPSLVKSSGTIGCLPDMLPGQDEVRWVPVDWMAGIVTELALVGAEVGEGTWTRWYHLANPVGGSWRELIPEVQAYYKSRGVEAGIVSFDEWVQVLEKSGEDGRVEVEKNPALKLLDFYQEMKGQESKGVEMDVKDTMKVSEKMRGLKGVGREWMRVWLEQWGF